MLSAGFDLTDNAGEACVLFPTIENCAQNDCNEQQRKQREVDHRNLPYWNGGQNHVVFDYLTDQAYPPFDVGKSILLAVAMNATSYRPHYDVLLPLTRPQQPDPLPEVAYTGRWIARSEPAREAVTAANASGQAAASQPPPPPLPVPDMLRRVARGRDLLLYFRGNIYGFPGEVCPARSRIFAQHFTPPTDQPDVVVIATCGQDHRRRPPHLQVAHCRDCVHNNRSLANGTVVSCTAAWPDMPFYEGLRRAKFAFAPSGCGPLSYRLSEAIAFGSVPVQTGDGSVLPFAGEGSLGRLWQECVIYVPERELSGLLKRLRGISEAEYYGRLRACVRIAALRLQQLDVIVKQSICVIAARVRSALGRSARWSAEAVANLADLCRPVGVPEVAEGKASKARHAIEAPATSAFGLQQRRQRRVG